MTTTAVSMAPRMNTTVMTPRSACLQEVPHARAREHALHGALERAVEATGAPEQAERRRRWCRCDRCRPAVDDHELGHIGDGVELADEAFDELLAQARVLDDDTQEADEQQQCGHDREEGEVGQRASEHAAAAAVVGAHHVHDRDHRRRGA